MVVVDCAPTAETLRLLALPEALGWYMDRVFPVERRIVAALRPVLARAAGVPMPQGRRLRRGRAAAADLREVQELLTAADATVRLVLTPEAVVVAEARRTLTSLSLFGYRVDGVVANRVFPSGGADAWRAGWVAAQARAARRGRDVVRAAARPPRAVPRRRAGRRSTSCSTSRSRRYGDARPARRGPPRRR